MKRWEIRKHFSDKITAT